MPSDVGLKVVYSILETDPETGSAKDKLNVEFAIELFLEVDDNM